jgi:protein-disulfide isomerase
VLIDEALLATAPEPVPTVRPVSSEEVEGWRIAHAAELTGDESRDTAAVRFLLERERRRARDRALIDDARRRMPPRIDANGSGATVGRNRITPHDVEQRAALALYRLRGEIARERLRQLAAVVDEQLWTVAAQARGTTAEQLRTDAAARAPAVTEADIQRYFDDEVKPRDPQAVVNPDRIRPYLEFRARKAAEDAVLAELRRVTPVSVVLAEPKPPRFALSALPGALSGAPDAPVRLVYLTSFRGTASRLLWETLRAYAADGTRDVSLAVRPLLPQWDPDAAAIAAAVACAAEQGRWWPILDTLSRADPLPDARGIFKAARSTGLDEPRFARCVSQPETPEAIARQSREAERLGLVEPPIVLVNGLALGAPSGDRLAATLARARTEAAGTAPLSAPSSRASASP